MNDAQEQHKTIKELTPGENVIGFYVVRKTELKTKKDGVPYMLLELGDSTGRITATLWDEAKTVYDSLHVGDIVKIKGSVMTYKDQIQMSVEKIRKAEAEDRINAKDFVPKKDVDIKNLFRTLNEKIDSVQTLALRNLLLTVFNDPEWKDRFKEAPGGKLWHHAYLGGLLEHTLAVVELCETMARLYPMTDRDLLITGALLHDIGKIEEYGYDQGFIDYTDEGRLWGHISIGAQRVRAKIEEMEKKEGFPTELKKHLVHLILSHQGELEHGSPVLPATLEAIILYYSDEMDSKANAIRHIIERDSEPGRTWSKFIPILERFIYLKNHENEEERGVETAFE